jgi:hypothetical protein
MSIGAAGHETPLLKCKQESGKLPNFVAVSFYSLSDLLDVVRALNGL